jgi:protease IV
MLDLLSVRAWALESNFFNRIAPVVLRQLEKGNNVDFKFINPGHDKFSSIFSYENGLLVNKTGKSKVAIVQVIGTMTKYGGACAYGMKDITNEINVANATEGIDGIVMIMDTPGGSVDGTPEFAHIVENSTKPIVTYVDGMMCSAGVFVGSKSDYIIGNANNPLTVGSIGTLCVVVDESEFLKKEGLKVEIIRAEQSIDKARFNSIEPLSQDQKDDLVKELTEFTDFFIASVKAGRGDKLHAGEENIFTGKTYNLEESLQYGLIDQAGTLSDAINKVIELSKKANISISNNSNSSNMKFPKLSSLFGTGAEEEITPEAAAEAEQALTEKENIIAESEKQIKALSAQLELRDLAIQEAHNIIAKKDVEIFQLKSELEKAPAGNLTTVIKEEDTFAGDTSESQSIDTQADHFSKLGKVSKINQN